MTTSFGCSDLASPLFNAVGAAKDGLMDFERRS